MTAAAAPLAVATRETPDGRIALLAPGVGLWRGGPRVGDRLGSGARLGELEVLGRRSALVLDSQCSGVVVEVAGDGLTRAAVDFGTVLVLVDPVVDEANARPEAAAATTSDGAVRHFTAPMSGRFYGRPSPEQPPFLEAGQVIEQGQSVGLLEVMKTFNRLVYEGPGLPRKARVVAILPADGDDLNRGDPILELEAAR